LLRFAYSWGHCIKIVLYLTETEILKLKTKGKVKDKRTLISTIRDLYRMYATLPTLFAVVGKMTTFYLRPLPLHATQQVDDLTYF
jgi:hypothetical protein